MAYFNLLEPEDSRKCTKQILQVQLKSVFSHKVDKKSGSVLKLLEPDISRHKFKEMFVVTSVSVKFAYKHDKKGLIKSLFSSCTS